MIYIYNYQKNVRIHIWQTNEMSEYIGDMKLKIDEMHEMMHSVIQEIQEMQEIQQMQEIQGIQGIQGSKENK